MHSRSYAEGDLAGDALGISTRKLKQPYLRRAEAKWSTKAMRKEVCSVLGRDTLGRPTKYREEWDYSKTEPGELEKKI